MTLTLGLFFSKYYDPSLDMFFFPNSDTYAPSIKPALDSLMSRQMCCCKASVCFCNCEDVKKSKRGVTGDEGEKSESIRN